MVLARQPKTAVFLGQKRSTNISFAGFQSFNTFPARLIQAVHTKTACSHLAFCGSNSGAESARELFKPSKDLANLVVCNEKNFFRFGFRSFCE